MLGTEMRPSSTISFEPGLERGMPWGRDLVTFMTSAAGYMMRTLQKPRKNKPSKRQVNHRRFLHNMIQRKFAEIEAANHQLASALFSVDTESQRESEVKSPHKHELEKSQGKATAAFIEAETKHLEEENDLDSLVTHPNESSLVKKSLNSHNNGKVSRIRANLEQLGHSSENSPEITDFTGEREQIQCASADLIDLTPISNISLEDSVFTSNESIEKITENSHVQNPNSPDREQQPSHFWLTLFDLTSTSPVSPLSLNSCDFEVQIQPDNDHTSQIHTAESLQMDLMENLDLLDSAEYLQQIDQMDTAAVWDIHNEKDLSCFQDSFPFFNTSHTDFDMGKQATCGDGDICGELQQITTLLEKSVKDMNVEDELRSNITYSLAHCGFSGHHNQARHTRATVDSYINQPEISTAVNKEGQCSTEGTWTVSENCNISSHVFQELKHDLSDQTQPKNFEHHLSYNSSAPREVKDPYYTLPDEENKMIESSSLHPNLDHFNPLSSSTAHCYGFDIPLRADSTRIEDSCSFANDEGNQSILSFEGVAQYFPAPHQNPHPHPVATPPLNDDWLFSNIATEVDFNSMVRSYGQNYC